VIIKVEIENFLSFDDKVTFSMLANRKRTSLSSHCMALDSRRAVLKMSAFYGANGAGKSNLFKAVGFLKRLVTQKYAPSRAEIERIRYALKPTNEASPTRLAIHFRIRDGEVFSYGVTLDETGILEESLKPLTGLDLSPVFERRRDTFTFAEEPLAAIYEIILQWVKKNPFASLVTVNNDLPILADARLAQARRFFQDDLVLVGVNATVSASVARFRDEAPLRDFGNALLTALDLGIRGFKPKTETLEVTHMQGDSGDLAQPTKAYSFEDGVRKVTELMFEQAGRGGYTREMDLLAQSDGSVRLLSLLPSLYDASELAKTVLVDELDESLHPNLVRELVRFYSMRETNGQLLFTTHQTSLLDQSFIRNDEVWLVEKHDGATRLTSLDAYKIHHTIDIERGYRLGHYGAVPAFAPSILQMTPKERTSEKGLS